MAYQFLLTERLTLVTVAILNISTFSGARTVGIPPQGFLFKVEAFSRMSGTHYLMVLRQGTNHDEEC